MIWKVALSKSIAKSVVIFFFFERVAKILNDLPDSVVTAINIKYQNILKIRKWGGYRKSIDEYLRSLWWRARFHCISHINAPPRVFCSIFLQFSTPSLIWFLLYSILCIMCIRLFTFCTNKDISNKTSISQNSVVKISTAPDFFFFGVYHVLLRGLSYLLCDY